MRRRTMLKAGCSAAAGSLLASCGQQSTQQPSGQTAQTPPAGSPEASKASPAGGVPPSVPAAAGPGDSSLPPVLQVMGNGRGLQLFFHGLCAFVLPNTGSDPLRVAMLNGYPDDPAHRHYATLIVAKNGVDLAASTARPSAVDSYHVLYGLNDVAVSLKVGSVSHPGVKVKKTAPGAPCATPGDNWANFGWVLDMTDFPDYKTGKRRAWSNVRTISQAQFETPHGSLEQDFDNHEQPSKTDRTEWTINGVNRVVKQAARLRVLEDDISLELTPRGGGPSTQVVLLTKQFAVSAAIVNLPCILADPHQPAGTRLTDALAYYQMLDPSPLGSGNDDKLGVPTWVDNPDQCRTNVSVECSCCPPSGV
jgi:hypothetical protein